MPLPDPSCAVVFPNAFVDIEPNGEVKGMMGDERSRQPTGWLGMVARIKFEHGTVVYNFEAHVEL